MHSLYKNELNVCKICGLNRLETFAHTATCRNCGVLLNFPYAPVREIDFLKLPPLPSDERIKVQARWLDWYVTSGDRKHHNFTSMIIFALSEADRRKNLVVLDYGGGGGMFALVMRSLFPKASTYIVDMEDDALLDMNKSINTQILFRNFESDSMLFDVIFMNDVYEHLSEPINVLSMLREKLKPNWRIFIDTPRKFWLYYSLKNILPRLQERILKGTVDHDHQQIWSMKAFKFSAFKAGFLVSKIKVLSEYTQPPSYYLDAMGIKNPFLRLAGSLLVILAPWIARNKIIAVLQPIHQDR